ncbi:MAG: hypothetical protein E5W94_13215 [Mesorhizobium sp.]|nr:MAG: hypothetical protein E5W94_13215 [Mesorhizobium sp.]
MFRFRCIDIQPACERRFPALPVLTYPTVRSVPVLGTHPVWSLRARLRLRLERDEISFGHSRSF